MQKSINQKKEEDLEENVMAKKNMIKENQSFTKLLVGELAFASRMGDSKTYL